MRKTLFGTWTLCCGLALAGCELFQEAQEGGLLRLSGRVVELQSGFPVEGAIVHVEPYGVQAQSDAQGFYRLEFDIDSTMSLLIRAQKAGYEADQHTIWVVPDKTIEVPLLRLRRTEEAPAGGAFAGAPASIQLFFQSDLTIGVREGGAKEWTELVFRLVDSLGRPVRQNAALVRFRLGVHPGGGEFLAPTEAPTDAEGKVRTVLTSGTRAGVVQVIAEATVSGRLIRAQPVSVAIHGGLPDGRHFTLAPEQYNFPGLRRYGLSVPIEVIVGDQYANPVRPGTTVYFTSTHGIIEGSVQTDERGRGQVRLSSANPLPEDGIAVVTASTADRLQRPVTARVPILFSGYPVLTLSPAQPALNQTYRLRVTDQNGNPLAAGTRIEVRVEGTAVLAVGNTDVTLDDTVFRILPGQPITYESVVRGPGITDFTFRTVPDPYAPPGVTPSVQSITVRVSGPNGNVELVLSTLGRIYSPTPGARLHSTPEGGVRVLAPSE
ncbi:MAG: Ig-like domain-containing protein [Bacteroidetes bacterium]|nr:Ig-like domain-containing protein [Rhodothermia bacterium]MCX7906013.1 Ig-like domain-containing protein [Bacteroidota bacterium]MDW8285825.1 hypothetical protein [Bacteroidota bacterium]